MHFKTRNACFSHPLIFLSQTHHLTALNDQYIQYPACMQGGREVSATTQLDQGVLLPHISLPFCLRKDLAPFLFSRLSLSLSASLQLLQTVFLKKNIFIDYVTQWNIQIFSLTSAIYKSKHKTAMANFPLPDVLLNSLSKKKNSPKK